MFEMPNEYGLDVRVGREIFGLTVVALPAKREPECGTIQLYEPWFEESIRERGAKWEIDTLERCSSGPWRSDPKTGFTGGLYPALRVNREGVPSDTEHDHYYVPMPIYSESLDEAWKVIMEVRKWRADIAADFWKNFDLFTFFMYEHAPAKAICLRALEAKRKNS